MMDLQVTTINMNYSGGQLSEVVVHFNGSTEQRDVHTNGFITLTKDEYFANMALDNLLALITEHIKSSLPA